MSRPTPCVVAIALSLALVGCGAARDPAAPAESTQSAVQADAVVGVGQLRRLVMLPVVYTPGECQWPDVAPRLDQAAVLFLRDWKGYEVIRPPRPEPALELARALADWQRDAGVDAPPAPPLRDRLTGLVRQFGGDGVLLVQASPVCEGTAGKALSAIASVVGSDDSTLRATVLNAAGTPAWHGAIRPAAWKPPLAPTGPSAYGVQRAVEELFQPMENALPTLLRPGAAQTDRS